MRHKSQRSGCAGSGAHDSAEDTQLVTLAEGAGRMVSGASLLC